VARSDQAWQRFINSGKPEGSTSRVNYVPSSRIISLTEHSARAGGARRFGSINIFVDVIPLRRVSGAIAKMRNPRCARLRTRECIDSARSRSLARAHAMRTC